MFRPLIGLAGAVALSACYSDMAHHAGLAGARASAYMAAAPTTADYLILAGAGDLFEIESSRVAVDRASNPDIRAFARMMIDHHQDTTNQVMAAARIAGLNPGPASLTVEQADKLAHLRSVAAADFDAAYMSAQLDGHAKALELHRSYALGGEVAPLRNVAGNAVPIVESHLARARFLAR
jgi:putative membrane protein